MGPSTSPLPFEGADATFRAGPDPLTPRTRAARNTAAVSWQEPAAKGPPGREGTGAVRIGFDQMLTVVPFTRCVMPPGLFPLGL